MTWDSDLSASVTHLTGQLDELEDQVAELVDTATALAYQRDRYRSAYVHTLATLAGVATWMRNRDMVRSATFIEATIAEIEAEVEGREEEAEEGVADASS